MFENKIVGGVDPQGVHPAGREGRRRGDCSSGVLAGYPMVDVKVELFDGSFHEVDSSEMAFKIAGSMAFKDACNKAGAVLLEPIMKCEVVTPEEFMGDVIGDLNSRRGKINGMNSARRRAGHRRRGAAGEMFGYATDLRSQTQGRATYTMQFAHYAAVPKNVARRDRGREAFERLLTSNTRGARR